VRLLRKRHLLLGASLLALVLATAKFALIGKRPSLATTKPTAVTLSDQAGSPVLSLFAGLPSDSYSVLESRSFLTGR